MGAPFRRLLPSDPGRPAMILASPRPPWAALALIALLSATFAIQHLVLVEPAGPLMAPGVKNLLALGALNPPQVLRDNHWHQVLTAPFLHADIVHLGLNCAVLLVAGLALEHRIGRAPFLALFIAGGLAGSLSGLVLNPPEAVSVGASGSVTALLAAALPLSLSLPAGDGRPLAVLALAVLVPSALPWGLGGQSDLAAHLGGAVAGLGVGLARRRAWASGETTARCCSAAALVVVMGAVATIGGFLLTLREYDSYQLAVLLIPNDSLPRTDTEAQVRAAELAERYPRDPRAQLMLARALRERDDLAGAEAALRAGLAERHILAAMFTRDTEWKLRAALAVLRLEQGDRAEALMLAREICTSGGDSPLRLGLSVRGLCRESSLQ